MKYFTLFLFILVLFSACDLASPIVISKKNDLSKEKESKADKRKTNKAIVEIVDAAMDNLGGKYKYGGTTEAGFDCSGLVYNVFKLHDITLPHNSYQQSLVGKIINLKYEDIQKGDLIFFKTNKKSHINHVGIVIEINDDEVKFIHSSTSKGVIISSTKEPYYKQSFAQVNRILYVQ